MSEKESKPLLSSLTVAGGAIALLPLVTELVDKLIASGALPPEIVPVVSGIGGLLAIVGRLRAKFPIKGIF